MDLKEIIEDMQYTADTKNIPFVASILVFAFEKHYELHNKKPYNTRHKEDYIIHNLNELLETMNEHYNKKNELRPINYLK